MFDRRMNSVPILAAAFTVLLCLFLLPTGAQAAESDWDYTIVNGEATIVGYYGWDSERVIPDTLGGCPVTTIAEFAFNFSDSMTSITIPDSVVTIEKRAFNQCKQLSTVIMGNGVSTIGEGAFYQCVSLSSIALSSQLTTIGDSAFYRCTSLTSLVIPDRVTTIGRYVFYDCTGLTSLHLGKELTSIGNSAFSGCTGLTSVALGDKVTKVGSYAFSYCSDLAMVTFGNAVEDIGSGAFYDCTALSEIVLPDSVGVIQQGAFSYCTNLVSVTIGAGVTTIQNEVFTYCDNLAGIWVDSKNTSYCSDDKGVLYTADKTKLIVAPGKIQGDYVIPNGVAVIAAKAFMKCIELGSVTIPASVEAIEYAAFLYCERSTGFWVDFNNAYFSSDASGVLFDKNKTEVIAVPGGLSGVYTIPEGVTSVTGFRDCRELTSLIIADTVTYIDDFAFSGCSGLRVVTLGDRVKEIGWGAFCDCTSLTSITVSSSVTDIGPEAFYGCDNLCYVYYQGTQEQWGNVYISSGNNPLKNAILRYGDGGVCIYDIMANSQIFDNLTDALSQEDYAYAQLLKNTTENVTVDQDAYLDLNGHTLSGDVTIADGVTLYVFDGATADYTAGNRGKIVGKVTGDLARSLNTPAVYGHNYKYLALEEEENVWSFHRYYLTVKSVILQPCMKGEGHTGTAVDYRTQFKCNDLVAQHVTAYGTKLVGDSTVYADYMAKGHTIVPGETNEQRTWLTGTFKTTNTAEQNAANALVAPKVSAYITLTDGTELASVGVQRSLQDMIVYANSQTDLSAPQKKALGRMYDLFRDVLDTWIVDITNIKQYAQL